VKFVGFLPGDATLFHPSQCCFFSLRGNRHPGCQRGFPNRLPALCRRLVKDPRLVVSPDEMQGLDKVPDQEVCDTVVSAWSALRSCCPWRCPFPP